MPNYNIVANNVFKNRSFEDLLKPLAMYTQEYNEIENAVSDLATKANIWEGMANEEQDPIAYAQYKRYADDLQQQATLLAQNGLNPSSRRQLLNLKKRYSSEITPIEQAYANRKAQADEQRKALLQNPTLLLSRRADTTSLDRYLDNPQLGYDSYSGALLTQQVGTAASAIAKELRDYGKGKPLDGFTKTWLQQHGFTAAEVAQAINNPDSPRSSQVLNTLVNNVIADSGVSQWADRATLGQAYNYAKQGLWQAVGQTQVQTYTDEAAKLAAQEAMHKRVAQYTAGLQNPTMNVTPKFDRRNVRTNAEMSAIVKDREMFEKYGKYFELNPKTGNYSLTKEGMKKYKETPYKYRGAYSTASNDASTEFKEWLDSRGLSEMAQGRTGKYQSSVLQGMMNSANNLYDTNTAGEYTGLIDSSQYDNIIGILGKASQEGKLKNYERKKKGNSYEFVPTDDVDVSDLTNSDIKSAVPVFGKHGNFLEVTLKGGDRIIVPYNNLNTNYNTMVTGNVNDALMLEQEIAEAQAQGKVAYHRYSDGRIVPSTVALTDVLNQGYDNFMSGLGTSQVEPQKTTRGLYQMR